MTTKAPSAVQEAATDSLEKIAYESVAQIPTVEPNEQQRIGYQVWRWLGDREGTIQQAIAESGARMKIPPAEAAALVTASLAKRGIAVP